MRGNRINEVLFSKKKVDSGEYKCNPWGTECRLDNFYDLFGVSISYLVCHLDSHVHICGSKEL